jgi:hypothetical protein
LTSIFSNKDGITSKYEKYKILFPHKKPFTRVIQHALKPQAINENMKFVVLSTLLASSLAFAPIPNHLNLSPQSNVVKQPITTLNVLSPPSVETATPSTPSKVPEMIDENVYNFNKFVIDTVYDIICLVYPVRGTKRDFARFFVLETVARV